MERYSSINYADAQGHILAYDGKRARTGEAAERAKRAKDYLVKVRRINPKRIVIFNAGHREKSTIELYLLPAGGDPPLSRPD